MSRVTCAHPEAILLRARAVRLLSRASGWTSGQPVEQPDCDWASGRNKYIYHGRCHTANRLRISKLTQLTIFHTSSPRVYRHGDSSRRCTVATVQDEANPSSSQPAASCCVVSESTEAHTGGWREYVLAEESVLPRKQPKRKRGV